MYLINSITEEVYLFNIVYNWVRLENSDKTLSILIIRVIRRGEMGEQIITFSNLMLSKLENWSFKIFTLHNLQRNEFTEFF